MGKQPQFDELAESTRSELARPRAGNVDVDFGPSITQSRGRVQARESRDTSLMASSNSSNAPMLPISDPPRHDDKGSKGSGMSKRGAYAAISYMSCAGALLPLNFMPIFCDSWRRFICIPVIRHHHFPEMNIMQLLLLLLKIFH